MGKSDEISDVVDELKHGHPETRKKAAMKLGRIRDVQVIPYLEEAIKKDNYHLTRVNAIQSLAWLAVPEVIDPIIFAALNDEHELVRKTAIEALGNLKDERALPHLLKIVNNSSTPPSLVRTASIAIQVIHGITPKWSQNQ